MATALKIVTAPAAEPVSTAEAKAMLNIESSVTADDTIIGDMITAARQWAETHTGRAWINQTWDYAIDAPLSSGGADILFALATGWPFDKGIPGTGILTIPKPPLSSVTSITTYGRTGTGTVFSSASYSVDTTSEPGRIWLNDGYSWPSDLRDYNSIIIRFVAGYGASASYVPMAARIAIRRYVATLYEHREEYQAGVSIAPTGECVRLLSAYRDLNV